MEIEDRNPIATVVFYTGFAIMAMGVFGAVSFWSAIGQMNLLVISMLAASFISGISMIGFSEIINQLHQIRLNTIGSKRDPYRR